jgi:hypothetical protein
MRMTSKIMGLFTIVMMTSFAVFPAGADPVMMVTEKDWGAYRYEGKNGRMCFVSSVPTKSTGKYDPKNRGDIHVFVSHGPAKAERNVVQVIAGYRYKKQSDVTLKIDRNTFKLFTMDDRAYAESEEDDLRIIKAMKRGSKMTVVGTSSRGTVTTDTYSLLGFTKAKSVIDKTCK